MQRYKVTGQLGDGTYGSVFKAVHRATGEVVAVKKMKRKFHSWDECLALQEVRAAGGAQGQALLGRPLSTAGASRRSRRLVPPMRRVLAALSPAHPPATHAGARAARAAPPLHRAAQGGGARERRALLHLRVHGGQRAGRAWGWHTRTDLRSRTPGAPDAATSACRPAGLPRNPGRARASRSLGGTAAPPHWCLIAQCAGVQPADPSTPAHPPHLPAPPARTATCTSWSRTATATCPRRACATGRGRSCRAWPSCTARATSTGASVRVAGAGWAGWSSSRASWRMEARGHCGPGPPGCACASAVPRQHAPPLPPQGHEAGEPAGASRHAQDCGWGLWRVAGGAQGGSAAGAGHGMKR